MARRSKKNPAYVTKEQIVKDIAFVLNARLTHWTKHVLCRKAISEWTEHSGKYKGCRLWSRKAWEQFQATSNTKALRHEHAVPKKLLVAGLMRLKNPTEKQVDNWFKLATAVIVTQDEEKLLNSRFKTDMPLEFYESSDPLALDVLLRYKRSGIDVIGVEWPDEVI